MFDTNLALGEGAVSPPPDCPPGPSLALEEVYRVHWSRLSSVARRVLGCPHVACDVVQEALIELWQQDPPPRNPLAWLVQAVFLRSQQADRSRRRRRAHEAVAATRAPEAALPD